MTPPTSVSGIEFTQELAIFDLLDVDLYHGWLSDPSDNMTHPVVSECTYNQLVEMAINDITSDDSVKVNAGMLMFLASFPFPSLASFPLSSLASFPFSLAICIQSYV